MTEKKSAKPVAVKKPAKKKSRVINVQKIADIYERKFNVAASIEMAMKGGTHEHSKYKYSRELDIIQAVKPHMIKERIWYSSTTISHEKNEKLKTIGVKYTLYCVDKPEDKIEEVFYGEGEDKSGSTVGTPIAYTMSLKYWLAKTFMIETGDDAELEKKRGKTNESAEAKFEKAKKMIAGTKKVDGLLAYAEKLKDSKTFNDEQKKELHQFINEKVDSIQSDQTA